VRARVTLTPAVLKLESWAKRCPQNFRHKAQLARAQLHNISGQQRDALAGYGSAAKSADEHGYAQVAALAHLLAARLHARQANATERDACLQRARDSFQRWGASALADQSNLLELNL
jgi:hypothetical protein